MKGRVLVIAGSDSGGGAGIQADIKTITALNGFAMTAITALTAQNSLAVTSIYKTPPEFVAEQIRVTIEDLGVDVIKTGMMVDASIINSAADALEKLGPEVPWVVDPVMVSTARDRLLDEDAVDSMKRRLISRAQLVTPNMAEAEVLAGITVSNPEEMISAGKTILDLGASAVLVTGGHLEGNMLTDVLVSSDGVKRYEGPRFETRHTHGTGCTLASAISCGIAQGLALEDAVHQARNYVAMAIRLAPGYGSGHGPLNHSFPFEAS
jgi:hydroxymethylpyrimidine/phosphomethylpyrimidine kinase